MKLLIGVSSRILYAHTRRDRETSEKMQTMEKATAEKIMASLAHNISTRFASLPILLAQYCSREGEAQGIKKLNDKFQDILTDISTTITRAKERLAAFAIKRTEVDLVANIERTLRSTLSDKVWSLESNQRPLNAMVDSHLLETALLELIQNSRDMIEAPDQLRITVTLEGERIDPKDWVRITYKDNGPGVPEEFKKRIFDDFFTRRPGRKTGTGLGLGFVRRVIEAHGGVVLERGEFGRGAEFTIGFPARPVPDQIKENGHVSHLDR
jgi:signal transduction histidine kinase